MAISVSMASNSEVDTTKIPAARRGPTDLAASSARRIHARLRFALSCFNTGFTFQRFGLDGFTHAMYREFTMNVYKPHELKYLDQPLSEDDLLSAQYAGADPACDFRAAKLPDKWSDLLDLAVEDAIAASRRRNVTLDMGDWVLRLDVASIPKACSVCMAGAVMLREMGAMPVDVGDMTRPMDLGDEAAEKLRFINYARTGEILWASDMPLTQKNAIKDANNLIASHYDQDLNCGRAPWPIYQKAAKILREAGL